MNRFGVVVDGTLYTFHRASRLGSGPRSRVACTHTKRRCDLPGHRRLVQRNLEQDALALDDDPPRLDVEHAVNRRRSATLRSPAVRTNSRSRRPPISSVVAPSDFAHFTEIPRPPTPSRARKSAAREVDPFMWEPLSQRALGYRSRGMEESQDGSGESALNQGGSRGARFDSVRHGLRERTGGTRH